MRVVACSWQALLLAVLAACSFGADAQTKYTNVTQAAQKIGLTVFLQAVRQANLTSSLADPQAVILAPTNTAFADLLASLKLTSLAQVPADTLSAILLYHVVPFNTSSPTFRASTSPSVVKTSLEGQSLTYITGPDGSVYVGGVAPGATFTAAKDTATAGKATLYVISEVLLPVLPNVTVPYRTVLDAIADDAKLSTLRALVAADQEVLALAGSVDTAATFFAPTNAAFTTLLTALKANVSALLGSPLATRILKTHVLGLRPYTTGQLPAGETTDLPTLSTGDTLTVTKTATSVTVAGQGNDDPATVVLADVLAGKSVVHVIDTVILPDLTVTNTTNSTYASVSAALEAVPQLSTLATAIKAAGLTATLATPGLRAVILAPTNAAFTATLADLSLTLTQLTAPANRDALTSILQYHVLPITSTGTGNVTSPKLVSSPTPNTLKSNLTGQGATYATGVVGYLPTTYFGGVAPGALGDLRAPITAGQATLYLVDRVLLPVLPGVTVTNTTLLGALTADPSLSLLAALVQGDAGLAAAAADPDTLVTLFAPTDTAVIALLDELGLSAEAVVGTPLAARILRTHIVPLPLASSRLATATLPTLSDLDTLDVTLNKTKVTVAGPGNVVTPVGVVTADVTAGKSVIHVIDGVLRPGVPELVEQAPPASPLEAATKANLTALVAALQASGLSTALDDPELKAVVLAPTDAAFTTALTSLGYRNLTTVPRALLTSVLQYHVLPATVAHPLLTAGADSLPSLLKGQEISLTTELGSTNLTYLGGVAPGAQLVLTKGVKAGQATVYVIDAVLLPVLPNVTVPYGSVADALDKLGSAKATNTTGASLSLLAALVAADPEVSEALADPNALVTVFAPADAAIEETLAALNLTAADIVGTLTAKRILEAHIVISRPYLSTQLPEGPVDAPTLGGDDITITRTGKAVSVSAPGNTSPVDVVLADVRAGKGVVHVIDGVLLPANLTVGNRTYPSILAAIRALNLTALEAAVTAASLVTPLSDPTLRAVFFAPTNVAAAAVLPLLANATSTRTAPTSLAALPVTTLGNVLLYHVLPTKAAHVELTAGSAPGALGSRNASGLKDQSLTLVAQPGGRLYVGGAAPGGLIDLASPIKAGNATLYLTDRVLLPVLPGVTVSYASPAAAVTALRSSSGLALLSSLIAADPEVSALLSDENAAVTIFAPTDTAISQALVRLGTSPTSLSGTPAARRILQAHVVPRRPYLASQFSAGVNSAIPTLSGNDTLTVTVAGGSVTVAVTGSASSPAAVVTPDVRAGKAVIHVINGVLVPTGLTLPPANTTRTPPAPGTPPITPLGAGHPSAPQATLAAVLAGAAALLAALVLV